jgi:hypothetical protein
VEGAKPAAGKLFNGTSLNADEIRTHIGAQVPDKARFEKNGNGRRRTPMPSAAF